MIEMEFEGKPSGSSADSAPCLLLAQGSVLNCYVTPLGLGREKAKVLEVCDLKSKKEERGRGPAGHCEHLRLILLGFLTVVGATLSSGQSQHRISSPRLPVAV